MSGIYHLTGNPFVDSGIAALCSLSKKDNPMELELSDLRRYARRLPSWFTRWKLGAFFGPNPKFSNPAIPKEDRKRHYAEYLNRRLEQIRPASNEGTCAACGSRDADVERVFREIHPLTGSGTFLNFFSFFEPGLPLCAACVLAIQFAPLYSMSRRGRLVLIHSHDMRLMVNVARLTVHQIQRLDARGGQLDFFTPRSYAARSDEEFLVKLVYEVILPRGRAYYPPPAIRMYVFRNSGQRNELGYIDLPTQAFHFLQEAYTGELNASLDELFKQSSLEIYQRLVTGRSIWWFFIDRRKRRVVGGSKLFELYVKVVEGMDPARLEAIRKVGKRLSRYLEKTGYKQLRDLEVADGYQQFLLELNRIQKDAVEKRIGPIVEIDDFTKLFPENQEGRVFWKETQNILLLYVYELMHKEKEVRS